MITKRSFLNLLCFLCFYGERVQTWRTEGIHSDGIVDSHVRILQLLARFPSQELILFAEIFSNGVFRAL
jgi:hypothetical protein